jgi:hypothetical protein
VPVVKVNLSLCKARWPAGQWRYSSIHFFFCLWMQVGGQLHFPLASPLQQDRPLVIAQWVSMWAWETVWTLWRNARSLAPAGNGTTIPRLSSPWPGHSSSRLSLMCPSELIQDSCACRTSSRVHPKWQGCHVTKHDNSIWRQCRWMELFLSVQL